MNISMIPVPGKKYEMMATQVTQELYESVMGENPSWFRNDNKLVSSTIKDICAKGTGDYPAENVSWYDAIYFCNLLSKSEGLKPVYAVNGKKSVSQWNYKPHRGNEIKGKITQDVSANGYRLPTLEEWQYAAKGGQNFTYSGSNNIDVVAWYFNNSNFMTHPVAQKKANGYGLYDMSGNVWEWVWDFVGTYRYECGGSFYDDDIHCSININVKAGDFPFIRNKTIGFRLVRSLSN
ncbi:SUMF1/EgtB/PvdO family nonheme iron enzyme [uncultured Treponema sp.]|uniref:formylglycine-generating enzyme family protein n=1 Tax=uncultured Treponema sp. TaxID=162155 RepID=UPI002598AC7D|nr:SUMF1/EgtB/PvdO family nonheme iron enzyme [uncultured Treponema sp.]